MDKDDITLETSLGELLKIKAGDRARALDLVNKLDEILLGTELDAFRKLSTEEKVAVRLRYGSGTKGIVRWYRSKE